MSGKHALLSPSGAAKWLACPGALALESLINVSDTGSSYAREGTAAHKVLETSLREDLPPSTFLDHYVVITDDGESIAIDGYDQDNENHIKVTQDMVNAVEVAVEYVERLQAKNSFYEQRVDFSHIVPDGSGLSDIVLEVYEKVAENKKVNTLYVIDYKHGKGIRVDAFENPQLMLYGLGSLDSLDTLFERDIERVILVVLQPRTDNISEYEISVDDLVAWGNEIRAQAQLAYDLYERAQAGEEIEAKYYNPTEKGCRWCQGSRTKSCKAQAQAGYSAAVEGFDDMTTEQRDFVTSEPLHNDQVVDSMLLDNTNLAAIHKSMKIFLSFAAELDAEIRSRISAGERVPGLKLIPTEKPRAWIGDEADAVKAMRTAGLQKKDYEVIKTITPSQAEKLLKEVKPKDYKRRYKRLELTAIHRPAGNDKIVEDNSIEPDDFDDLLN